MRTIYKYRIEVTDNQVISVPTLSGLLNFKNQFLKIESIMDVPYLWCLVDTENNPRDINLKIIGTGNPVPRYLRKEDYLGSFQIYDGAFIGHIFLNS
jgi:hypothetical protein